MSRKTSAVLIGICILTHFFSENVLAFTQHTYLGCPNEKKMIYTPKKDDIRYQYIYVNGVQYRRLYNFTTQTPLSDWERV